MRLGDQGGRRSWPCTNAGIGGYSPTYRPRKTVLRCAHCGNVLVWMGPEEGFAIAPPQAAAELMAAGR